MELIAVALWLPQAAYQFLNWIYWVQLKEYRSDRFRVFVKSREGREKLFCLYISGKFIVLIFSLFYLPFLYILFGLFLYQDFLIVINILKKNLRKPVFTKRASRITFTQIAAIIIIFIYFFYSRNLTGTILLGEISLLVSPFLGVAWTLPLVNKARKEELKKAQEILSTINPKIIGITGSYGKTTTKDFLAHLLSSKYKTEKTFKNQNTDFGIARKIINEFEQKAEVFVVEMGAYKKGDIKKLAEFVKPGVGIITGIEPQHLELFGSLDNIIKTKFELIRSLPENGYAIFNLNDPDVQKLYENAKKLPQHLQVYGYYQYKNKRKNNYHADMISYIKQVGWEGINFEISEGTITRNIFTPIHGTHLIENLTGAILTARLLGVSWNEIKEACRNIETPEGTMKVSRLSYQAVLIDDSYNSTPKSFEAAVNYLNYFRGKEKVVITPGIIELGKKSQAVHKKLGKIAAEKLDKIIVTNKEPAEYFIQGLGTDSDKLALTEDTDKLIDIAERYIERGSVILLEGRLPNKFVEFIYKRKL